MIPIKIARVFTVTYLQCCYVALTVTYTGLFIHKASQLQFIWRLSWLFAKKCKVSPRKRIISRLTFSFEIDL